jgi:O-methyltransferase domain/Dimerisation domain
MMNDSSPQQQMSRMLRPSAFMWWPRDGCDAPGNGYWIAQALYVVAKLRLADFLKNGPMTAENLALVTQSHPRALYRLLRALASIGVFVEGDQQCFSLTPLAELLRSDVPGSQRAMAIMGGEVYSHAWAELLYSVQTGQPAFEKIHGLPLFEYLNKHPELARCFDECMMLEHRRETDAILDGYDFSGVRLLADIGGGNGSLLTAVLRQYPNIRGILFDLPGVVERAKTNVQDAGIEERCQLVAGNFFESVPNGADAYLLRHIIHDWNDEKATRILQTVQLAMGQEGRLLVAESVIPPGKDPSFSKLLDLAMLVALGGQERTETEYRVLYETTGFRVARIVPVHAEVNVIEGRKV